MSVRDNMTDAEFLKKVSRIEENIRELEDCFRRLDNTAGGTASYWEGAAGREHQLCQEELMEDAARVMQRMRERNRELREKAGFAVETEPTVSDVSLPSDIL